MNLPKLSAEEQKQFENGVIRVEGTAMNWTALGILTAFFKLYPNVSFDELKYLTIKKLKTIIIIIILFYSSYSNCQTIIRSSINSFGNSNNIDNFFFCQSAGQSSNTNCFVNAQQLRQGFQQPIKNSVQNFSKQNITINLYPNPASEETSLIITGNIVNYEIVITLITGTELKRIQSEKQITQIDCSDLPNGLYLLSIVKNNKLYAVNKLIINK
jgi:hypothetical protein